ncbi:MAG: transporter substrate-binding domain-containing protein [Gammaproteobacteria bacterium]|nr:transporter substrate-binding domain-containing protein [Gammaproteobacteria bacterium]
MGQKKKAKYPKRFTLRFTILTTFFLVSGLVALVALFLHYYFSLKLADEAAEEQFIDIAERSAERALQLERRGISLSYALQNNTAISIPITDEPNHPLIFQMANLLQVRNGIFSLFLGKANGNYLELSNLEAAEGLRTVWQAAPQDRWALVRIFNQDGQRIKMTSFLNDQLKIRLSFTEKSDFRSNERPWFAEAKFDNVTKMPPYLFSFVKRPGISYSIRTQDESVVGATTLLSSLDRLLQNPRFPKTSQAFIFDESGFITAFNGGHDHNIPSSVSRMVLSGEEMNYVKENPVITVSNMIDYPPYEYTVSGSPRGYSVDLIKLLAQKIGIQTDFKNGYTFSQLLELFFDNKLDLMTTVMQTERRREFGEFSLPIVETEIIVASKLQDKTFSSLEDLKGYRIAAQNQYAVTQYLQKRLPDQTFIEFDDTQSALEGLINNSVDVVLDHRTVIEYITKYHFMNNVFLSDPIKELSNQSDFALHFLAPKNNKVLIGMLNRAYKELEPNVKKELVEKWLTPDSSTGGAEESLAVGQLPTGELLTYAKNPYYHDQVLKLDFDGETHYVFVTAIKGFIDRKRKEYIALLISEEEAKYLYMNQVLFSMMLTLLVFMCLVPIVLVAVKLLVNPINDLIHENNKIRKRQFKKVKYIPSKIRELHQLSISMVSMSEAICEYEVSQKQLLDAFIKLIAQAIDEKSPYTGGHCERVPVLAKLLAEAACESNSTAFKDFKFKNAEQWREFQVASWLHDCGKITTPEHIVDKGVKLEAIYNRIHEIRMRFEVLWRDAEIDYLKQVKRRPEQQESLKQILESQRKTIQDDFAFVAACNIGGEFMSEEQQRRLKMIAQQTWTRYLDSNLGLSSDEMQRTSSHNHKTPSEEFLLDDKPEHITYRIIDESKFDDYGFTMRPPKIKQNLGEVYNLSTPKGTLTDEDRYIINEHIISTIRMLETLPLPPELKNVPEYAGGHHERMDGRGYPKGLTKSELSIPARIMAVADIFEALTASDRPYKTGKPLSESLQILRQMALQDHVDKDLFKLFIESRVYTVYAKQFLSEEQIDEVNPVDLIKDL